MFSKIKADFKTSSIQRKFKRIQAKKPDSLDEFIGKTLITTEGVPVVVETIVGSMAKPTRFEINGAHHVVILSAYKQLHNDTSITQEMINLFDQSVCEEIHKIAKPSPIEAQPALPKFNKD